METRKRSGLAGIIFAPMGPAGIGAVGLDHVDAVATRRCATGPNAAGADAPLWRFQTMSTRSFAPAWRHWFILLLVGAALTDRLTPASPSCRGPIQHLRACMAG